MSGRELESYWHGHVEAWKDSGLTLKGYAEAHGIGRWALGRWSRRFAAVEEVSAPCHRDSPGAVPMTASAPLVMEIVEAAPRRRRWSQTAKEQLVAETCEPGVSVSLVARRRGVDPSLLFRWRRQMLTPAKPPPLFAPVEVADTTPVLPLTASLPSGASLTAALTGCLRRKNSLFAGSEGGGHRWAVIASLVETCKLNDVEPFAYLRDILERMVNGYPASRIADLLPWNWKPAVNS